MTGKEFGRPFLKTLLWRDKRVWRRAGTQPRDLDYFAVLKITEIGGCHTDQLPTATPCRHHAGCGNMTTMGHGLKINRIGNALYGAAN